MVCQKQIKSAPKQYELERYGYRSKLKNIMEGTE